MSAVLTHRLMQRPPLAAVVDFPVGLAVGDIQRNGYKWQQIFTDDFKTYPDLPVGSFDSDANGFLKSTCAAYPYLGSKWTFYPDGGNTTHGGKVYDVLPTEPGYIQPGQPGYPARWPPVNSKYYPSKTLAIVSLGDGNKAMEVNYHTENVAGTDYAMGANMKPINIGGTYKFDAYFRTQFWMRATEVIVDGVDRAAEGNFTTGTDNRFHWVPLGIDSTPSTTPGIGWPGNGELDWPEGSLNRKVRGNYHPAASSNETWPQEPNVPLSPYQWNLFTMEWTPGLMKWWVNTELVLNTTDRVPTGPMAFQFQHEADWRQPPPGSAKAQIRSIAMWKYVAAA